MDQLEELPLVSVILSVYDGEKYLRACLESIEESDYPQLEVIVVNDGSTDGSDGIIKAFLDNSHLTVKYIPLESNKGLVFCLNLALERSRGKYIARIDADDTVAVNRFSEQVRHMEEHLNVGVLGSWINVVDENGQLRYLRQFPRTHEEVVRLLPKENPISHPSVMIRAAVLQGGATYRRDFPRTEDYDLWIRLSAKTRIENYPKPLTNYRIHNDQISVAKIRKMSWDSFRLKWRAIQDGYFGWGSLVNLIPPLGYLILPTFILKRRLFRDKSGK